MTTYVGVRPRQVYSINLILDINPISNYGNNQIVVMVDNFSKFVKIRALKDRTLRTLAKWLMEEIVGIFGPLVIIKSDNGSEFKRLFELVC